MRHEVGERVRIKNVAGYSKQRRERLRNAVGTVIEVKREYYSPDGLVYRVDFNGDKWWVFGHRLEKVQVKCLMAKE